MLAYSRSRVFVVFGVIFALALAFLGARFVNVPQAQNRAISAWSEVELQYQLRASLTQDIIEAVRLVNPAQLSMMQALEDKREKVLALSPFPRTPYSPSLFRTFMETQDELSMELGKVLDFMKLYPEHRAMPAVSSILAKLVQSESRIVIARSDYLRAAEIYNELIDDIPTRWLTSFMEPKAEPMIVSFKLSNLDSK